MDELRAVNLKDVADSITRSPRPNSVLWQEPDTLAFVARGRDYRSEFHVDPVDEVMYMIKGDMDLHYITPAGEHRIATIREGEIIHCPAGTPHSPRFSPDAFVLVMERKRRPGETDRFQWFCDACRTKLFETSRQVTDYRQDVVSRAYEEFYASDENLTCSQCGTVAPRRWGQGLNTEAAKSPGS
jgi:3-hydroxyanthranilate 3,4-dioxygenase